MRRENDLETLGIVLRMLFTSHYCDNVIRLSVPLIVLVRATSLEVIF
jgi:hypothetical protein